MISHALIVVISATCAGADVPQLEVAAVRIAVLDLQSAAEWYGTHLNCTVAGDFAEHGFAMLTNGQTHFVLTPADRRLEGQEGAAYCRLEFVAAKLSDIAPAREALTLTPSENPGEVQLSDQAGNRIRIAQGFDNDVKPTFAGVAIRVHDLKAAESFYATTLGFEIASHGAKKAIIRFKERGCAGFSLLGGAEQPASIDYGKAPLVGLAFSTPNLDASIASLREKGVKFLHDQPQQVGNVRFIAFADPSGNVHELITHVDEQPPAGSQTQPAEKHSTQAKPSIDKLHWLAGTWVAERGDSQLEEIWSCPNGDAITGSFRWSRSGKAWMLELMSIVQASDGLTLRLRHFDAALTPWEKDGPLVYPLVRLSEREAVFEDPQAPEVQRIVYVRDGETLVVRLEKAAPNQPPTEFRFTRKADVCP